MMNEQDVTVYQERRLRGMWGDAIFEWWRWWLRLGLRAIEGRHCYSGPRWWWFVACKRIASGWWGV